MLSLLFFFILSSRAEVVPLPLPVEVMEDAKRTLSLERLDEISYAPTNITVKVNNGKKEYELLLGASRPKMDFADFGFKTKEFHVQFQRPEGAKKPEAAPEEKPSGHGSLLVPAAHAEGHGAPAASSGGGSEVVYFINRYQERQSQGQSYGLPCGKAVKIQSHLDDLFGPQGIKVSTAEGRHLDRLGGDFVWLKLEEGKLHYAFFTIRDGRFKKRLCSGLQ